MNTKFFSMFLYSTALYVIIYKSNNSYVESLKKYVVTNVKNVYNLMYHQSEEKPVSHNNERIFTLEELGTHVNPENGLYLSILGKVYDVSSGAKFYGPGGTYNGFVGNKIIFSFLDYIPGLMDVLGILCAFSFDVKEIWPSLFPYWSLIVKLIV